MSIQHAIAGLEPDEFLLSRFALVGAEFGDYDHKLSLNDLVLFGDIKNILGISWGLASLLPTNWGAAIDVININENHGGRDFLREDFACQPASVLAFCNIPENAGTFDDCRFNDERLRSLFAASQHHNNKDLWQKKILETTANFIFIYGSDSMNPLDLVNMDMYVAVPSNLKTSSSISEAIFIRKDYLLQAYGYLIVIDSPLLSLADRIVSAPITQSNDAKKIAYKPPPPEKKVM